MATNTAALKTFAQQTRSKLLSLIGTKMDFVLTQDNAELRGYETQIGKLKEAVDAKLKEVDDKSKNPIVDARKLVAEEVSYTWFNRVMALRFMDANGYNTPMVVTAAAGQMRPELLQDAMAGSVDEDLRINPDDLMLPEAQLYRRLLVAVCNKLGETMPFLFEHICDYTELLLPDDLLSDQSFVSDIRKGMTDEDCQNVEIMGWLYQFYITDRKDDAEKKKTKKGGLKSDEQAAATQLFTPHWVVRYMVENSLGRIWMTLHPESSLMQEMPYYIPTPEGQTDTIPEDIHNAADIRFIDPCCGSGHILVYAFDLFCKMYEEEGYTTRDIPTAVLTNNLYGLDIDRRCYQLASFALTMKARAYHSRYLRRPVQPNILALQNIDEHTIGSTGDWDKKSTMWQFEHIDTIGSLLQITPEECAQINVEEGLFSEKQQVLKNQAEYLSGKYHCVVTNPPYLGKGFGEALNDYLKKHYSNSKADTMVAFMERLMTLCSDNGKMAMINLPSWMFLSTFEKLRMTLLETCHIDSLIHMGRGIFGIDWGSVAFTYSKGTQNAKGAYFRLHERNFQHIYYQHIGQLFLKVKSNHNFKYDFSTYRDEDVSTIDIFDFKYSENGQRLYFECNQADFEKIPGSPIGYWVTNSVFEAFKFPELKSFAEIKQGLTTSDNNRFIRNWFEVSFKKIGLNLASSSEAKVCLKKWFPHNKGGEHRKWYGNLDYVLNYYNDGEEMKEFQSTLNQGWTARIKSREFYFHKCLSWSMVSSNNLAIRYYPQGTISNIAGPCIFDLRKDQSVLGFLNSKIANFFLKVMNPTINNNVLEFNKLPIKENQFLSENLPVKENVKISRLDWDAHETSWDFQSNEIIALDSEKKYVDTINEIYEGTGILVDLAAPQLHSLEWRVGIYKAKWENKFHRLHANEEELNRQFIEIYGLQDELTPDVPLNEITILQKGEISIEDNEIVWHEDVIIKQLISYLVGCFMGRYSVDKPGLIIANQHQDLNALGLRVDGIDNGAPGRLVIDDDGIVPILNGEYFSDDMTVRIEQAIKVLFGEDTLQENLRYIDAKLGKPLREYLFKDFFADHIDGKMYQKRPIYWSFSSKMGDKRKKGHFKALVYMHRIEPDTLSKLHADYVVPYIDKIEQQQQEAEDQTLRDDLSQAQRNKARKAADELSEQLREVKDFEQILVQMASQRISIDLDDGVRKNYPKFYPLVEPIKGLDKEE